MKKQVILFIAVLVVALVWLPRKSIEARLVIAAPPEAVWKVLTDTDNYSAWNPIFVTLTGEVRPGSDLALEMTLEDGQTSQITVSVDAIEEFRSIQQSAGVPCILTAHHEWRLEPIEEGTLVVQHETYRGVGVLFYDPSYVELLYQEGLQNLKSMLTPS